MHNLPILFAGAKANPMRPTKYVWSADKYALQNEYLWRLGDLPDYPNRWVADDVWATARDHAAKLPPFLNYYQSGVLVGRYNAFFISMQGNEDNATNFASIENMPFGVLYTGTPENSVSGEFGITLHGETYLHEQAGKEPADNADLVAMVDVIRVTNAKTGKLVFGLRNHIRANHTRYTAIMAYDEVNGEVIAKSTVSYPHPTDPGEYFKYHLAYKDGVVKASMIHDNGTWDIHMIPVEIPRSVAGEGPLNLTLLKQVSDVIKPATSYINKVAISKNSAE